MKNGAHTRINIYLPDRSLRSLVKAAAAKYDVSVSDYCVQAITARLKEEGLAEEPAPSLLKSAVTKARRFVASTFKGRRFSVSSADLIRETRLKRNGHA